MLRTALSRTFWSVHDALGSLVLGNVLWTVLTLPWLAFLYLLMRRESGSFLIVGWACVVPIALLNPGSAGLAAMGQELAQRGATGLRTYWSGLGANVFRTLLLMGLGVLMTMIVGSGLVYYLRGDLALLGRSGNVAAAVATGLFGVLMAAWSTYWLAVAIGVAGKSPRVVFVLQRSWGLVLDSPGFAIGVLVVTLLSLVFWCATVLGLAALGVSVILVFQAHARQVLYERSDVAAALRRTGVLATRHEIQAGLRTKWSSEPRRRFRDIARRDGC